MGCKDIRMIKSEFVAKTQFLYSYFCTLKLEPQNQCIKFISRFSYVVQHFSNQFFLCGNNLYILLQKAQYHTANQASKNIVLLLCSLYTPLFSHMNCLIPVRGRDDNSHLRFSFKFVFIGDKLLHVLSKFEMILKTMYAFYQLLII